MKKLYLLLAFLLVNESCGWAQCTTQLSTPGSNNSGIYKVRIGQSFQVNCNGTLNSIVFTPVGNNIDIFSPSDNVTVGLRLRNSSGTIIANGLINGQTSINSWGPNNTYTFSFTNSNVTLAANTTYSWELYCVENIELFLLDISQTNPYVNGNAIFDGINNTAIDLHGWAVNVSAPPCSNPTITSTTPSSRCGSGNVSLSATPSSGSIQWYTTATGGTALTTNSIYTISGNSITLNNLATTTTLYAEAVDGNCVSTTRTAVSATVISVSDNVTTISACNSYTWANNGQTYTTSGVYTGTTTNCVTEKLNLTITPSTDNLTTISACNSYTWANNGQTYTTSGVYSGTTTNCVTEKLNLTITPSTDNVTTISACNSYTWANNGQTYTTSGVYTGTTTNCVTEKLNLTITPSTDNLTTISACNSYTWANNGQTYTTSGVYTGTTTNCVTEKLNLTIIANPTTFAVNGINYNVTSASTVEVGSNTTATGAIVIPETVTNACVSYTVTRIGTNSFYSNTTASGATGLTTVTLPNTITEISAQAFRGCTSLTSINIPNSVTNIANGAFQSCTALTTISIPNSVTNINTSAFAGCTSLSSVSLSNSLTTIGDNSFRGCTALTSIVIPNSVTTMSNAFQNCSNLYSVTLSNSLTSLTSTTFAGCTALTNISLPNSLTNIGNNVFNGCTSLSSIILPYSLTNIGSAAFRSCISLTTINIPANVISINNDAFRSCTALTSLSILPNSFDFFGVRVFQDCTALTSVTVASPTPFTIDATTFLNVNVANATLNVPSGTAATYDAAPVWTNFGTITAPCVPQTFYLDADNDGFGNPSQTTQACTPPSGYVATGTDCDDNNPAIHPNAIDVCYDGIDNDCNGNIDNIGLPGGCTPISSTPVAGVANTTIPYGTSILTSLIPNAQGYRYRVTRVNPTDNSSISAPVTVDMSLRNLFLSNLSIYAYSAKYKIETTVRINNVWQPNYAPAFYVFTPSPVSTMANCGTQIVSTSSQVISYAVPKVTQYRYQVQRLDATNNVVSTQVITSALRYFSFDQITDFKYDANYNVSCAIRNLDGVYMDYGPACTLQAPKHPTSELQATYCNNYTVTSANELIYANAIRYAAQYRFRLFNEAQTYDFAIDKSGSSFRLNDFPGVTNGAAYSVQVAVKMPGQPDFGPYSKTCTIIVPAMARTIEVEEMASVASFEVMAYPNPFAENVYFKVTAASAADYTIQVYDMLGKLVENRTVSSDSIESTEVGANFPAGVYNVILTQGENSKTLRVVKR